MPFPLLVRMLVHCKDAVFDHEERAFHRDATIVRVTYILISEASMLGILHTVLYSAKVNYLT